MREILKKKNVLVAAALAAAAIVGTAATLAIVTAEAGTIKNSFEAGEIKTHIEEEFDGNIEKNSTKKKNPSIKNDGKSNAFIRARITISPEDAKAQLFNGTWKEGQFSPSKAQLSQTGYGGLYDSDADGIGWYCSEDGWYYYSAPIAPGEQTDTLFDVVKIGDADHNFDITVYQEAVFSGTYEAGKTVSMETITQYFEAIDQK